jgi:hypothetical protein
MRSRSTTFNPGIVGMVVFVAILAFVVFYIARRDDTSPFAKAASWVYKTTEGFNAAAPTNVIQCPTGYSFFNDAAGGSFCCKANIQNKQCAGKSVNDLCAFAPNVKDPRNSTRTVKLCSEIIKEANKAAQDTFCSTKFPNYVNKKCCRVLNPAGTDCAAQSDFCVTTHEQSCLAAKLVDIAGTCPSNGVKTVRQLSGQWTTVYPKLQGMPLPTCEYAGPNNTLQFCIPNTVIDTMKAQRSVFVGKNNDTWTYACQGGYTKKFINKDTTLRYDEAIGAPAAGNVHSSWLDAAREYYNTKGQWKGIYRITESLGARLVVISPTLRTLHMRYRYEAVRGSLSGEDTRTFRFEKQLNGIWICVAMGGSGSGSL